MLIPSILNAANEEAVALFLEKKITYLDIPEIIEECMKYLEENKEVTIDNVISLDKEVRKYI